MRAQALLCVKGREGALNKRGSWRDRSVVKNTACSSRGREFKSQRLLAEGAEGTPAAQACCAYKSERTEKILCVHKALMSQANPCIRLQGDRPVVNPMREQASCIVQGHKKKGLTCVQGPEENGPS